MFAERVIRTGVQLPSPPQSSFEPLTIAVEPGLEHNRIRFANVPWLGESEVSKDPVPWIPAASGRHVVDTVTLVSGYARDPEDAVNLYQATAAARLRENLFREMRGRVSDDAQRQLRGKGSSEPWQTFTPRSLRCGGWPTRGMSANPLDPLRRGTSSTFRRPRSRRAQRLCEPNEIHSDLRNPLGHSVTRK